MKLNPGQLDGEENLVLMQHTARHSIVRVLQSMTTSTMNKTYLEQILDNLLESIGRIAHVRLDRQRRFEDLEEELQRVLVQEVYLQTINQNPIDSSFQSINQ